jgi:hypothetical protein
MDADTAKKVAELRREVDQYWAYDRRRDYLIVITTPQVYWALWSIAHIEIAVSQGSAVAITYWEGWLKAALKIIIKHVNELYYTRPQQRQKTETITQEQIDQANNFPITDLIEFKRDMAVCFSHADKDPSLHHIKDRNRAYCFSCQKQFSPIDVLMIRDGYTFQEAVRRLL